MVRLGILAPDLTLQHGWGAYSLGLLQALQRRGVQLHIAAARDCPPIDGLDVQRLLPSVSPARRGFLPRLLACAPAAARALRGCELIHTLAEPYAPLGVWAAGARPHVLTAHGTYARLPLGSFPRAHIYRQAFATSFVVCVSRYSAQVLAEVLPEPHSVVVNNGVNADKYLHLARRPVSPPVVLSVGAVKARKGTLDLVQAAALLPGVQFSIVGSLEIEPGYVAEVRAAIESLGVADRVHLRGRLPDDALMAAYEQATIAALPAREVGGSFEGYGLALIEASAAGLPVVSTLGSGTEDAVEHGVTGLLVPQADPTALAAALAQLLEHPDLRMQMAAAGRSKAAAQSWDAVAERYLRQVYLAAAR